jgi:hypothetical protein
VDLCESVRNFLSHRREISRSDEKLRSTEDRSYTIVQLSTLFLHKLLQILCPPPIGYSAGQHLHRRTVTQRNARSHSGCNMPTCQRTCSKSYKNICNCHWFTEHRKGRRREQKINSIPKDEDQIGPLRYRHP